MPELTVGAILEESVAGQSKADFVHKNSISLIEARESNYWLRLILATSEFDENVAKMSIPDKNGTPSSRAAQRLKNAQRFIYLKVLRISRRLNAAFSDVCRQDDGVPFAESLIPNSR